MRILSELWRATAQHHWPCNSSACCPRTSRIDTAHFQDSMLSSMLSLWYGKTSDSSASVNPLLKNKRRTPGFFCKMGSKNRSRISFNLCKSDLRKGFSPDLRRGPLGSDLRKGDFLIGFAESSLKYGPC